MKAPLILNLGIRWRRVVCALPVYTKTSTHVHNHIYVFYVIHAVSVPLS